MPQGSYRKGGYRSGKAYLSMIKARFILRGGRWSQQLDRTVRDLNRALVRGLGPARKADPLPLELLASMPGTQIEGGRKSSWPASGFDAAIISAAWLLRELESSAATMHDLTITEPAAGSEACGWAEWLLPASKTDPSAEGVKRSLACACPSPLCPVNAARQVLTTAELIRQQLSPPVEAQQMPLLCKSDGSAMSKLEVVEFFKDLADLVGMSGLRMTGHSARVTGAMRMAFAGHVIWTIQVFGRWGSAAVLGYVRDAILGLKGEIASITERGTKERCTKLMKATVEKSAHVPGLDKAGRIAAQAIAKIAYQQLRMHPEVAVQGATDEELEETVGRLVEQVKQYSTKLKLGRQKVLRSKKGLLHIALNSKACLCGWEWSEAEAEVVAYRGPVVDEATGWCRPCHTWAREIAGGGD